MLAHMYNIPANLEQDMRTRDDNESDALPGSCVSPENDRPGTRSDIRVPTGEPRRTNSPRRTKGERCRTGTAASSNCDEASRRAGCGSAAVRFDENLSAPRDMGH